MPAFAGIHDFPSAAPPGAQVVDTRAEGAGMTAGHGAGARTPERLTPSASTVMPAFAGIHDLPFSTGPLRPNGVLYCGVTTDLVRRVAQHRAGDLPGFTRRYGLKMLVWFETHGDVAAAIAREKAIKHWTRADKVRLIHEANPDWRDLWDEISQ